MILQMHQYFLQVVVELKQNHNYFSWMFAGAFSFAGMFAFLTAGSFVYIDVYGVGTAQFGYLFGLNVVGLFIMTTINGTKPPSEVSRYTDGTEYLLNVKYKGMRYVIETGNRASDTRSGVHMHDSGGVTWILDGGDMSIFVQGLTPTVFEEEERFYMPASVPMSAVNVSGEDSVQMNIFVVPLGEDLATDLDPSFAAGKS